MYQFLFAVLEFKKFRQFEKEEVFTFSFEVSRGRGIKATDFGFYPVFEISCFHYGQITHCRLASLLC